MPGPQVRMTNSHRTAVGLSLVAAVATAAGAGWTAVHPELLLGPAAMNGSARGTGVVMTAVAVPVMLLAIAFSLAGPARIAGCAPMVWLGALAYLLYNDLMLLFGTPFNSAFLLYVVMLTATVWATGTLLLGPWFRPALTGVTGVTGVAGVAGVADDRRCARVPARSIAVFSWVVAGLNALAWLRAVVPALSDPADAEFLRGTGLTTNPVYVQDLALWLPLAAVVGWWLWHRRPAGVVLAGGLLTLWVLESVGIAVDQWFGSRADPASPVASADAVLPFAVAAVLTLVPLVALLTRLGPGPDIDTARAPSARLDPLTGGWRRLGLVLTGAMALLAVGGAVGLAGNGIDLPTATAERLPWQSEPVAAVALLLTVAIPMAVATVALWRSGRWARFILIVVGLILMSWIVVESAIILTFSWLQPACLLWGAAVAALGWFAPGTRATPVEPSRAGAELCDSRASHPGEGVVDDRHQPRQQPRQQNRPHGQPHR